MRVKLTVKCKLDVPTSDLPSVDDTFKRYREACEYVSGIAWETKKFGKVALHHAIFDSLIREKAEELDVEVKHLAIKPDHVRLFVTSPSEHAPSKLARQFNGFSSRVLRRKYRYLTSRMPLLLSRSFYVGAAGGVSDKTVADYIAAQETRNG